MDFHYGGYYGRSSRPDDRSGAWLRACRVTCGVQIAGGLIVAICASLFLFNNSKLSGQMIGGLLIGVGAVGLYGSMKSNREALNVHLLGVLLAMMMAFNFIGQVAREMDVDCALAEMYVRGRATEDLVKKQHESELFNTMFNRIDEMEDMLQMMERGTLKAIEHREEQQKLKNVDAQYIESKLQMLHDHAEEMAKHIMSNDNITDEKTHNWSQEEKDRLETIMEVCTKVIRRIKGLDERGQDDGKEHLEITYDEYEEMLADLLDVFDTSELGNIVLKGDTTHLDQAVDELDNMESAMDRLANDMYSDIKVGKAGEDIEKYQKDRKQRRDEWIVEFATKLSDHKKANDVDMTLQDLPEHCLVEGKGRLLMNIAGFMVLIAQFASGFCVLSTLFKIPVKVE